jgi:hypothetical protein
MATKRATKRKRASRKPDVATDEENEKQILRTTHAVFRRIEQLVEAGEEIPLSLLGTAKMCRDYRTAREMLKTALPDLYDQLTGSGGKGA